MVSYQEELKYAIERKKNPVVTIEPVKYNEDVEPMQQINLVNLAVFDWPFKD